MLEVIDEKEALVPLLNLLEVKVGPLEIEPPIEVALLGIADIGPEREAVGRDSERLR